MLKKIKLTTTTTSTNNKTKNKEEQNKSKNKENNQVEENKNRIHDIDYYSSSQMISKTRRQDTSNDLLKEKRQVKGIDTTILTTQKRPKQALPVASIFTTTTKTN
jgi:hypothetical protein